jgi:ketosteroid isomerase-like protein
MTAATTDEEVRNKELVLRFLDAAHESKLEEFLACLDVDAACYGPGPDEVRGRETLRGQITEVSSSVYVPETTKMEVQHIIADGPYVAVQFILRATTPAGNAYVNYYHHLFECRDGLITAYWKYLDTAYAQKTLALPDWLAEANIGIRGNAQPGVFPT